MSIAERWTGHPPLPSDLRRRLPGVTDRLRQGGAKLIYLFGSGAEESGIDARSPHHVDLAVWGLTEDRWLVQADLAETLGTDRLDLVPLEDAGPELGYHIISTGTLLHADSAELENRVEMSIMRTYHDIAPFRRTQAHYLRARNAAHGP